MWQHIKIPLKTPDDNLYEIITEKGIHKTHNKTTNISIESLYPKLVDQIKTLRKKLKLLVRAYTTTQKEKDSLINDLNSSRQNEKILEEKIKAMEKETKKFKEEVASLTSDMTKLTQASKRIQQNQVQNVDSDWGDHRESSSISYELKTYTDVEEKFMDGEGKAGETYQYTKEENS